MNRDSPEYRERQDLSRMLLVQLGEDICTAVRKILLTVPIAERTRVHEHAASDVIYSIDHEIEQVVVDRIEQHAQDLGGIVLIAEGIGDEEKSVYPAGMDEEDAALRFIIDPIDGTRPIMYDKRSAFFLGGAAPNLGSNTRLSDIDVAVMVEIPTTRAAIYDVLWAIRNEGAFGERVRIADGSRSAFVPTPSDNPSIHRGFVQFVRFFNPGKGELGSMEDELMTSLFPDAKHGENLTFEDQYLSTGGQLYELMTGKDRLVVDVRSSLFEQYDKRGWRTGHPCHPYDHAASLIATEAGVILTKPDGSDFDAPMDTLSGADWIGYANLSIQREVERALTQVLRAHSLVD